MGQVTMSSQEYAVLQRKADKYDAVVARFVENIQIDDTPELYVPVSMKLKNGWPAEICQIVATSIGQRLALRAEAMKGLIECNYPIFDMEMMHMSQLDWSERLYSGQYDLREVSPEFKAEWDRIADGLNMQDEKEEEEQ